MHRKTHLQDLGLRLDLQWGLLRTEFSLEPEWLLTLPIFLLFQQRFLEGLPFLKAILQPIWKIKTFWTISKNVFFHIHSCIFSIDKHWWKTPYREIGWGLYIFLLVYKYLGILILNIPEDLEERILRLWSWRMFRLLWVIFDGRQQRRLRLSLGLLLVFWWRFEILHRCLEWCSCDDPPL